MPQARLRHLLVSLIAARFSTKIAKLELVDRPVTLGGFVHQALSNPFFVYICPLRLQTMCCRTWGLIDSACRTTFRSVGDHSKRISTPVVFPVLPGLERRPSLEMRLRSSVKMSPRRSAVSIARSMRHRTIGEARFPTRMYSPFVTYRRRGERFGFSMPMSGFARIAPQYRGQENERPAAQTNPRKYRATHRRTGFRRCDGFGEN